MKPCVNCGSELNDSAKFCPKCGTPQPDAAVTEQVTEAVNTVTEETAKVESEVAKAVAPVVSAPVSPATLEAPKAPKKPMNKKPFIIGGCALAAVAVIVAVVLIILNSRCETIDAKDLVTYAFSGPDGHATGYIMIANDDFLRKAILEQSLTEDDKSQYAFGGSVNQLWRTLDKITEEDEEKYPDGVASWIKSHTSGYLSSESKYRKKAYQTLTDTADQKQALKKLLGLSITIKCEEGKEEETLQNLSAGDEITVRVHANEEKLKNARVKLKNTEFTIMVGESDVAELKKVDPWKGFDVSASGFSGSATITFNWDSLTEENRNMFNYSYDWENLQAAKNNGDKVVFTCKPFYDYEDGYFEYKGDYYEVSKKDLEYEFKVSGLDELKELKPFEKLQFSVSGTSPRLEVSFQNAEDADEVLGYISYRAEYPEGKYNGRLAIGDKITITASTYYETKLAELGYYLPENATYEYTIDGEGLAYLIQDFAAVENVDFNSVLDIETLKQNSLEGGYLYGKNYIGGSIVSYNSEEIVKEMLAYYGSGSNMLYVIYDTKLTAADWSDNQADYEFFSVFQFRNVYVDENGETQIELYSVNSFNTLDEAVTAINNANTSEDATVTTK